MTKQLLALIVLLYGQHAFAQNWTNTNEIWQDEKIILPAKGKIKNSVVGQILKVRLNIEELKNTLANTPVRGFENDFSKNEKSNHTVLQMPMPDGGYHAFQVAEAPVMHPHLANKFPQLKAYIGKGIDDPTAVLRFDITPNGFHGMILSGNKKAVFIDPAGPYKINQYLVYYKNELNKESSWVCSTEAVEERWGGTKNKHFEKTSDCQLRTYRFALACTGEYAQYHGGTTELVLAAMHNSVTRLNGILERDLSVHLELVAENDLLVFPNQFIDPYTNNDAAAMLGQNQATCDEIIGEANYDIGHLFSTNGGGVAQLKSVCKNGLKAQGVTGSATPEGDEFDVDYLAHEIGHQLGASHTQNNNCNRNLPTAVEPGSGSTIMGYAGICAPNIQGNSDAYFHSISISEINDFLSSGGGSCAIVYSVNNAPSADAGPDYFIPRSTPFKLTGLGNDDASIQNLTYSWEQLDNQVSVMPPAAANDAGPLFRSVNPANMPFRVFPNIKSIIENKTAMWEVLPSGEREIDFRFTVRDNHPNGGCTATDDMTIYVAENAGPFIVEGPVGVWVGGSQKKVEWEVAATNEYPVNSQHIDILLSLNGGNSFPIVLASNVPNIGHGYITVPNVESSKARLMARSSDNIFFDISDEDFRITPAVDFYVELHVKNLKCLNDNSGKITAKIFGGEEAPSFLWSNGSTDHHIEKLPAGNYSLTVTSGPKIAMASVEVKNPPPIELGMEVESRKNSSEIFLKAFSRGGTGRHIYEWDNGGFHPYVKITGPGNYSVTVTDKNNCRVSKSKTVLASDIENSRHGGHRYANSMYSENYIHVFPNPTSAIVNIDYMQLNDGGPKILLLDVMGRELKNENLLYHKKGLRNISMDVSIFNNGIYFLQIVEDKVKKTVKIVKI